jgi:hypothetical protein
MKAGNINIEYHRRHQWLAKMASGAQLKRRLSKYRHEMKAEEMKKMAKMAKKYNRNGINNGIGVSQWRESWRK